MGVCLEILKNIDLLSFMSSFKCYKNFPLKIKFFDSNFFDFYTVAHYTCGHVNEEVARVYFPHEMEDFSVGAT